MKKKIRSFLKKFVWLERYCPFSNRLRLRSATISYGKKRFKNNTVDCRGSGNQIILLGEGTVDHCRFFIRGNGNTILIGSGSSAVNGEFWIEDDRNTISIGEGTNLTGKIQLACIEGRKIEIGNNCLFSSEVVLRTGDSHSILNAEGERINPSQDIQIADRVWVGHRVAIQKGVKIQPDTVIGANAVVTKSVEQSNVIVAGCPARVIKENVSWDSRRL